MIYEFKGMKPKIHKSCFIAPSADIIGNVEIGENSSVWFGVVIRGDVNQIRIGKETNIQDGSVFHVSVARPPHEKGAALTLGDRITVGHSVTLHGCTVKDGALIGMGAVVLDDAVIGEEAFVAAGAVVTPRTIVPPRSLVVGSPAKVLRELRAGELEFMKKNIQHYIETAAEYMEK